MNRLLKNQISEYVTGKQPITREFMELMERISDTYDYFEKKLNENLSTVPSPKMIKPRVEFQGKLSFSSFYLHRNK